MDWATELGYKTISTFWQDFEIAEHFGASAIIDTAYRAFHSWKDNIEYLTELIMVINHKSWYFVKKNTKYSQLYADLYYEYDEKAIAYIQKNMSKEELNYYFRTLD